MDTNEAPAFIAEADKANGVEVVNGVDANRLRHIVECIERLEEEKKALATVIKETFDQAKSERFDVKAIKEILKLRKKDEQERQEEEFFVDAYRRALGID